ncbi:MAG: GNAT family N-acetyltransferase [Acidimicrobiales bacterium]
MKATIGALREGELVAASQLLAHAFAEDPIITHYLHDPVRRAVAFPAFFEGVLQELIPSTQVFGARSGVDLVGVAAWLPPEPVEPDDAARARAYRSQRIVQTMFPLTAGTLFAGFAALEELHPVEPHWYLAFIGIEPNLQSRGLGRELLAPVLHVADETKTMCYLETPFPRTHAFYERLGFALHAEYSTFDGAPQGVVTFVRPPRS